MGHDRPARGDLQGAEVGPLVEQGQGVARELVIAVEQGVARELVRKSSRPLSVDRRRAGRGQVCQVGPLVVQLVIARALSWSPGRAWPGS